MAVASPQLPPLANQEWLSELFGRHHRRILLAAYRITGNMADAEDVTQSVFLRLAGAEGAAVANAPSYLYRAAINGALDTIRRRKSAANEPLDAAAAIASEGCGSHPEAEASRNEMARCLRQAVAELSHRAAEMFTLRCIEGLGNGEIARLMGTSQAVVAVTVHQARSKLRKRLAEMQRGNR